MAQAQRKLEQRGTVGTGKWCHVILLSGSPRQEEGLSRWEEKLMGVGANSQLAVSPGFKPGKDSL